LQPLFPYLPLLSGAWSDSGGCCLAGLSGGDWGSSSIARLSGGNRDSSFTMLSGGDGDSSNVSGARLSGAAGFGGASSAMAGVMSLGIAAAATLICSTCRTKASACVFSSSANPRGDYLSRVEAVGVGTGSGSESSESAHQRATPTTIPRIKKTRNAAGTLSSVLLPEKPYLRLRRGGVVARLFMVSAC